MPDVSTAKDKKTLEKFIYPYVTLMSVCEKFCFDLNSKQEVCFQDTMSNELDVFEQNMKNFDEFVEQLESKKDVIPS